MRAVSLSPSFGPRMLDIRIVGTVSPHEAVRLQELLDVARTYYGYDTVTLRFTNAGATPRSATMLLAAVQDARSHGVTIVCTRDGPCGRSLGCLFPEESERPPAPPPRVIGFAPAVGPGTRT